MKTQNYIILLLVTVILSSCNPAQSQSRRDHLPGREVLPGSELMDVSFFEPFTSTGMIDEVKNGIRNPFRKIMKKMRWIDKEGKKLIEQVLTYRDPKNDKVTGIHKTYYDPATLQVVYWDYYKNGSKGQFAFKAEGTKLSGTQSPGDENAKWRTVDVGLKLFQNESRELLFRALGNVPVGTEVKFPIIGMQPPFHGWVSYKYAKDQEVSFNGKKVIAQLWQASNNAESYYQVIKEEPYVILRALPTGGTNAHVFSYQTVQKP